MAARGKGRIDYSHSMGEGRAGASYSFTTAMLPQNKESVRLHRFKFTMGMVMHAGACVAILGIVLLVINPDWGCKVIKLSRPLLALAFLAASYLFVRRFFSANLRMMSAPDDYVASFATCGLLAVTGITCTGIENIVPCLFYAALFFLYFPLGKLRHAVFFFAARDDLGRRLGYRGVYPPAKAHTE
jgi:hypothetical protein